MIVEDFCGNQILVDDEIVMPGVIGVSNKSLILKKGKVLELREVSNPQWDGNVKVLPEGNTSPRWYRSITLIKPLINGQK